MNVNEFHRIPVARLISGDEDAFDGATFSIEGITEHVLRQTYTINWTSSNTFYLNGSSSGDIKTESGARQSFDANGTTQQVIFYYSNPVDTQAAQEVQFTINIDLHPNDQPSSGDVWEFSVDDYLGNLEAQAHEIVVATVTNSGTLDSSQINLTFVGGI